MSADTTASKSAASYSAVSGGEGRWMAEGALVLVTVAVAVTSTRLFRDASFLPRALLVVAIAHGSAFTLRRRGVGLAVSSVVLVVIAAVAISALYLGSSTWFGLPTGRTIDALQAAERGSFGSFRRLVVPVPVRLGFELTLATILWVLACFADTATFRGESPVQAIVPHAAVFIASAIYARGRGAAWATVTLMAAFCVHLAAQRAWRLGRRPWIQSESQRGTRWILGGSAAITAFAVLIGGLGATSLPGASSAGLVDLRELGRGPGPVEVGNPLVGISNLLGSQSNAVLFKVKSAAPHYWRQTSLEEYDPVDGQWKTRRSYHDVAKGQQLGKNHSASYLEKLSVSVTGMPGIWLPSAFRPSIITTDLPIRYDDDSESIIAAGRSDIPATSYDVTASIPSIPAIIPADQATIADPQVVPAVYRAVPPSLSPVAQQWFDQLKRDVADSSKFEAALEIQRRFRAFVYDATVNFDGPDPLDQFLVARRGFCQQFSSAFALFARELGIPSRVAVGFSWGDPSAASDATGRETYVVRGRHAHAWPELFFDHLGWVAFEPTPGRGNPDSESYTKVPAAEALAPGQTGGAGTTTTTTLAATGGPSTTAANRSTDGRVRTEESPTTRADTSGSVWGTLLIGLLAVLALLLVVVGGRWAWVRWRRRRRRRAAESPSDVAALAWADACDHLITLGVRATAVETPGEFGHRAAVAARWPGATALAEIETVRRYAEEEVDADRAVEATRLADEVAALSDATMDLRHRLLRELGWGRRN